MCQWIQRCKAHSSQTNGNIFGTGGQKLFKFQKSITLDQITLPLIDPASGINPEESKMDASDFLSGDVVQRIKKLFEFDILSKFLDNFKHQWKDSKHFTVGLALHMNPHLDP